MIQASSTRLLQAGGAPAPRTSRTLGVRCLASAQATKSKIDWDKLGFGLNDVAQTMYVGEWTDGAWSKGELRPYGPLAMMPSAQVLNYGQAAFEGMKAQRSAKGRIVLFRPDRNAARLAAGAARLSMPAVPEDVFVSAVEQTVRANEEFVPPVGKGSLYIRPLLMGSGPILGLGPAPSYTFAVYAAAVGSYFKSGQLTPIDLVVEEHFHRAAPRGMGGTKAAGNYSPVLVTQLAAKGKGYSDVVYLDAKSDTYLEEVSSCNIFAVKGRTIRTPPLAGSILPGVTRASVIELARSRGYEVKEEPIAVTEAMEADEMFTTGTAVVVSPVGSLTYKGERRQYGKPGEPTPVGLEIYTALTRLQTEQDPDPFGWVHPVV
ncbi:branched-chain amino acid aminotransferase [Raphidocelis subcapitata]|uniref:Branched-chain-amino-acid aminotransferase n=1 Tax=Raphidocelis subcapitata TaxID=307507 RepID=A0A2V0NZV4_9CHLO|nr:branched-chain amino acid aminotransferase [Raphidocelis subcapitata]|eukprot:GBF92212.1 branched-chain amino acid aminotransferase [Raphidocelis subcapitata]